MKSVAEILVVVTAGLAALAVISVLAGVPIWLLWNWLMPKIFGLTTINLVEAIGLSFLFSCLFSSSVSTLSKDK